MSASSLPNPHQRRFLKKAPLETAKTFNKNFCFIYGRYYLQKPLDMFVNN